MYKKNNSRKELVTSTAWYREFTLRDGRKKSIKIEEWRTLQEEMRELSITENQIFQMQMVEKEVPKNNTKRNC
ncbi:hypothetical protein BCV52_25720 [Priestia aryabhattai]|nr:hypothetical protein BCV52_25720 [Priestia aryabhattai]